MQVAISGASGLVGSALRKKLQGEGHNVIPMVRKPSSDEEIYWNPSSGKIDTKLLEGIDAVVHLAGESIAEGRWNVEKKRRIRESRVKGTELIANSLAELDNKPKVFVCASAIGFYGAGRPESLDETAGHGDDFLAEVCQEWEAACKPAISAGIRTVHARFGVILSKNGGALSKMLFPFKMGGGGIVGNGKQVWSWVSVDDTIGALVHAIENDSVSGPVNVTAPNASTNAEFTKTLGHVLGRPTIIPLPAFAARLVLGEMADALLLASARVIPKKLEETGYKFQHEHLEPALRHLLK